MAAIDVGRLTEDEARTILENIRWPKGPVCPHCGSTDVYRLTGKTVRDGLFHCRLCREQFTVTVGTVMHRSHITLRQWVQAFHSMCSHKKGVSALQLQRNLGLHTYHCAWHLAHRIRLAMKDDPVASMLKGTVEVDETYIGGKPRKVAGKPGKTILREKTPVMVLIERKGRARSQMLRNVTIKELHEVLKENVDKNARILTDEHPSYPLACCTFNGGHQTVCHSEAEYARGDVNTNSAESYFALLKRGVVGTFHHVSVRHLPRYCDEFSFRWSNRKATDGERTVAAIKGIEGKRLAYKQGKKASA
jgi:transposase-like protein